MLRPSTRSFSVAARLAKWKEVPLAPPDKILGISEAYQKDSNSKKINLGVGAYRDNSGKPIVFPSVKKAETVLLEKETDKEYTGIIGSKNYQNAVRNFIFNNSDKDANGAKLIGDNRIVTAQTISGTGSLRVIADFLKRFYSVEKIIVPKPTWANHVAVFTDAGISADYYAYYDKSNNSLDYANLKQSISAAENESVILLHACCHNPTGMDLTAEQWEEVLAIIQEKKLFPLIDMAYQGFASGSPYKDISLIRRMNELVVEGKIPTYALCQSFAKNMGLYGERTGSISIVTESAAQSSAIESQLKKLIRPMYSNPPIHGSRIVETIFSDQNLLNEWLADLDSVVGRLNVVRDKLYQKLDKTNYNWDHLLKQRGMFIYTGLSAKQVIELREKYSVYATEDGRFSISGVNENNVDYLADAINKVISK
ncbi:PLP-dependent transferase [Metschnikowia bicuspidata var. bicuspidata NRRL YB-4993]|uniref:PLP-dependent transferase n=1 Tax=Metschnikowia bicuspidata var. bicuspidata NRRL YB-4993 TaxID=869754 RepID=A0A1A0HJQ4_9ASCO|nr:PLP-dependent transferase [Metschnikowia bicuspidata var. bicuspidata NRRL YB-4993]OBA24404.1 PLP-dependent transferase [Metschnikowia bicuspidata var. bicuspidata NRRL YB-4993]